MKNKFLILIILIGLLYYTNGVSNFGDFILDNPLPSDQFNVLIYYESSDDSLKLSQYQAINSVIVDEFVRSNNGVIKKWDKDIDTSFKEGSEDWFLNAKKYLEGKDTPYFVASKGNSFREGQIESLDELLSTLKQIK